MKIPTPSPLSLPTGIDTRFAGMGDLMRRYVDGDERAFSELHTRLAPRITSLVRRRISNPEAAKDLEQAIFAKAHVARARFATPEGRDPDRAVWTWYATIARNASVDALRKVYRQRAHAIQVDSGGEEPLVERLQSDSANAEELIDEVERRQLIRRSVREAIAELPASQREVVQMHKLDGLSMREISDRLEVREGTLRVRAHRAYRSLTTKLAGFAPALAR